MASDGTEPTATAPPLESAEPDDAASIAEGCGLEELAAVGSMTFGSTTSAVSTDGVDDATVDAGVVGAAVGVGVDDERSPSAVFPMTLLRLHDDGGVVD